jgi:hypothetical protein
LSYRRGTPLPAELKRLVVSPGPRFARNTGTTKDGLESVTPFQAAMSCARPGRIFTIANPEALMASDADPWDAIADALDDLERIIDEQEDRLPEGVKKRTVRRLRKAVEQARAAADDVEDEKAT